jgi:hypothetical protein
LDRRIVNPTRQRGFTLTLARASGKQNQKAR